MLHTHPPVGQHMHGREVRQGSRIPQLAPFLLLMNGVEQLPGDDDSH